MWMSTYFSQTYLKGMTKSLKVKRPKKRVTLTSKNKVKGSIGNLATWTEEEVVFF
jgi:hypothetical protein